MNKETEQQIIEYIDFAPPSDVIEDSHALRVILDVPGVAPGNVTVNVEDQLLNISAETELLKNGRAVRYQRSFQISDEIDVAKITAKACCGILELVLPKSESAKVRKIKVETV